MKPVRLLAVAILLALAGPAVAKDWTTVAIATEGAYPPYNFHGPDGKLIGFEIDLAADLCRRAALTCTWVDQDWDGIIPALQAGKYDAIMSGMSITAKRMEVIAFSSPYSSSPTTLTTLKGSGLEGLPRTGERIKLDDDAAARAELADLNARLKGKVVAVQVSSIQADVLNSYFKGVVEARSYKTAEEMGLDLAAGRVDAMMGSQANMKAFMDGTDGHDMVFTGPLLSGGPQGIGAGIGMRKADTDLKAKFDTAIAAAVADGTIRKLSIKWFKVDISPQ